MTIGILFAVQIDAYLAIEQAVAATWWMSHQSGGSSMFVCCGKGNSAPKCSKSVGTCKATSL